MGSPGRSNHGPFSCFGSWRDPRTTWRRSTTRTNWAAGPVLGTRLRRIETQARSLDGEARSSIRQPLKGAGRQGRVPGLPGLLSPVVNRDWYCVRYSHQVKATDSRHHHTPNPDLGRVQTQLAWADPSGRDLASLENWTMERPERASSTVVRHQDRSLARSQSLPMGRTMR